MLAWIKNHASKWKTFVANRVAEIHQNLPTAQWQHIKSEQNPADCASRGIYPSELQEYELWWKGPSILHNNEIKLQKSIQFTTKLGENRTAITTLVGTVSTENNIFNKFSSFTTLIHVIAYCQHFIKNCQTKQKRTGPLSIDERTNARFTILRCIQTLYFHNDVTNLKKGKPLSSKSPLIPLNPFMDCLERLRVGGRIQNSAVPYDQQHPIILPPHHHVTTLIILHAHKTTMHGGVELSLHYPLSDKGIGY